MSETTRIADAVKASWVESLPVALIPYAQLMRLDRPMPMWLLLLPCWWSLTLAQISLGGGRPDLWKGFLFLVGSIIMRGAGCTLNDIVDRDIDNKVERTRLRPLPAGRISLRSAFVFLGVQLLLGLVILLQFNYLTMGTALTVPTSTFSPLTLSYLGGSGGAQALLYN